MVSSELEHFVCSVVLHQVGTRSNVGRVRAFGNKLQRQSVAADSDTIGSLVVGAVHGTGGGARLVVFANSGVPLIASIAVRVSRKSQGYLFRV